MAKGQVNVSCVPEEISSNEKPGLEKFPQMVMFMSLLKEHGGITTGIAVYEPVFSTYSKIGNKFRMEYQTVPNGNGWVLIEYDAEEKSYFGKKFVKNREVGSTFGREWKNFFMRFTAQGLYKDEFCAFIKIKKPT